MATAKGDIQLNAKDYLLTIAGYQVSESFRTRPNDAGQPRTLSTYEHQNNWSYWGQSGWAGMRVAKFLGDGPFLDGYGLDLNADGELGVAKKLELDKADAANTGGYVGFRIGYADGTPTRVVFVGKTVGTSYSKLAASGLGSGWTTTANALAVGVKGTSHGFFNSTTFVGGSNGHIFQTADGITYTDRGTPGPTTDAMILGSVAGKMYIGYANGSIWAMDTAAAFTNFVVTGTILDQFPYVGAAGSNGLYIITRGPYPRILFTDGTNIAQLTVIGTNFLPNAAVFLNKLYIFGQEGYALTPKGAVWGLDTNGLEELLTVGDGTLDQSIRSAQVESEVILWGATRSDQGGVGVFDPRLDLSQTESLGFYIGSTTATAGVIHGLAEGEGFRFAGLSGTGIMKSTTPGAFKIKSGLFGGDSRNIAKYWGQAEVRHTALISGQSINVKSTKNPNDAEDNWNTNVVAGTVVSNLLAPTDYRTPYLSYIVYGQANGSAMTIYDIAMSYIRMTAPADVKREWRIRIAVEGTAQQPQYYRDGTPNARTSMTMIAELTALWNTKTTFQDLDGTTYTVLVKSPDYLPEAGSISRWYPEIDRRVTAGAVDNLSVAYSIHLVQL